VFQAIWHKINSLWDLSERLMSGMAVRNRSRVRSFICCIDIKSNICRMKRFRMSFWKIVEEKNLLQWLNLIDWANKAFCAVVITQWQWSARVMESIWAVVSDGKRDWLTSGQFWWVTGLVGESERPRAESEWLSNLPIDGCQKRVAFLSPGLLLFFFQFRTLNSLFVWGQTKVRMRWF